MRIPSSHQRSSNESAMTPMIDVVFLLLIFFVCTASFQIVESILPSSLLTTGSEASEILEDIELPLEQIIIKTTRQEAVQTWAVNERACSSLVEVQGILKAYAAIDLGVPVILDIGGKVPLGGAIDIYDLCRVIGYDKIQFAASKNAGQL